MRGGLNRVDHRPTKLLVSGHEGDEWEEVLVHFAVSPLYEMIKQVLIIFCMYFAAIW
jgi:hypothetical protein